MRQWHPTTEVPSNEVQHAADATALRDKPSGRGDEEAPQAMHVNEPEQPE
jgi:hypothetical protein